MCVQSQCRSFVTVLGGGRDASALGAMGKKQSPLQLLARALRQRALQAILSLACYGVGVPLVIGIVMIKYRGSIQRDQRLWLSGRAGNDTRLGNPDYSVRVRFSKLYQVRNCRVGDCVLL